MSDSVRWLSGVHCVKVTFNGLNLHLFPPYNANVKWNHTKLNLSKLLVLNVPTLYIFTLWGESFLLCSEVTGLLASENQTDLRDVFSQNSDFRRSVTVSDLGLSTMKGFSHHGCLHSTWELRSALQRRLNLRNPHSMHRKQLLPSLLTEDFPWRQLILTDRCEEMYCFTSSSLDSTWTSVAVKADNFVSRITGGWAQSESHVKLSSTVPS